MKGLNSWLPVVLSSFIGFLSTGCTSYSTPDKGTQVQAPLFDPVHLELPQPMAIEEDPRVIYFNNEVAIPATQVMATNRIAKTIPFTDKNGQVFFGVKVLYGTNRQATPNVGFGGDISDSISYGSETVLIPKERKRGEFRDRESLLRKMLMIFKDDDASGSFIKIDSAKTEVYDEADFVNHISNERNIGYGDILVFVHGFNVGFYDAIKRTGQVVYDLDLNVQPILFSWPSQGKATLYVPDSYRSRESVEVFQDFIAKITEHSSGRKVHVLAHSMGSEIAIPALAQLYKQNPIAFDRQFGNVILAAPDFSRRYFKQKYSPVFESFGRSTIYMTTDDNALRLSSNSYLNDTQRLGYSGNDAYTSTKIDAIDITEAIAIDDMLGHSRYGSSSSVLNDMHYMIRNTWRANERFGMNKNKNPPYWVFTP
jgi:esterase/lipase superfamily enzyme